MHGATVSVADVTSRAEAELIVGMLRSHGLSAAVSADDGEERSRSGSCRVFACWSRPPMKPRPVSSWPPSMTSPRRLSINPVRPESRTWRSVLGCARRCGSRSRSA